MADAASEPLGNGVTAMAERPNLGQMTIPGVELSYTALTISDPDLPYEAYAEIARAAGRFKTASSWWLGDLVNLGEELYGEKYVPAMEHSGLAYETLSNYAWVCRRIPRSRRRENLRFSHHSEVAFLEPRQQKRWLDAAEESGLTQKQLRLAIKAEHGPEEREQPRWTRDEPVAAEPLPSQAVAEAAARAEKSLANPLPESHPLWRSEAEGLARDVLSLARTVADRPPPEPGKMICPNCGASVDA